jgi:hypothetical protein
MSSQEQKPREESMLDKAKNFLGQKVNLLGYELTYGMILVALVVLVILYQNRQSLQSMSGGSVRYVGLSDQLSGKIDAFLSRSG